MRVEPFIKTEKRKVKLTRVLISGGGTGGHIFPAIAIANEIRKRNPDCEIEFVGAKGRMEMEKVPQAGYTIHGLWISGLMRKLSVQNLALPFKLISSLWKSRRIVKRFKPQVTIGVGGYASGPLNYMASSMGVPLLLQEQNSFPGITNKLLKNKAQTICVAYHGMEKYFPKDKIVYTGNPIRMELIEEKVERLEAIKYFNLDTNKKTILIIGGSLGAMSINRAIESQLSQFEQSGVQLIWQTGKSYSGEMGNFSWGLKTEFIKRMDLAYALADVVISRAGALSISEISALGKAAIFVPSPNVTEDHQTKNALNLVEREAALICRDNEVNEKIFELSIDLINDEEQQARLKSAILSLAKPGATAEIVDQIEKLCD